MILRLRTAKLRACEADAYVRYFEIGANDYGATPGSLVWVLL